MAAEGANQELEKRSRSKHSLFEGKTAYFTRTTNRNVHTHYCGIMSATGSKARQEIGGCRIHQKARSSQKIFDRGRKKAASQKACRAFQPNKSP